MIDHRPCREARAAWSLLALTVLCCTAQLCRAAESIVLVDGNVYTADDRNPRAEAVVVEL